jgi:hypothetical protein
METHKVVMKEGGMWKEECREKTNVVRFYNLEAFGDVMRNQVTSRIFFSFPRDTGQGKTP